MDGGAWQAMVQKITKSWTGLSELAQHKDRIQSKLTKAEESFLFPISEQSGVYVASGTACSRPQAMQLFLSPLLRLSS